MSPAPDPQPGDIGCTQITGDVGLLIRIGQYLNGDGFANYEHAFVYVGDDRIVEAEPGGARSGSLDEYDSRMIVWLRCPDEHRTAVATAAISLIGTPYSALDYAALAAHRFHIPVPGLRRYVQASGHLICSQLADRAAELGGWTLFNDGRWPGYVTPADLANLAELALRQDA
jgi:hypothetical protein